MIYKGRGRRMLLIVHEAEEEECCNLKLLLALVGTCNGGGR